MPNFSLGFKSQSRCPFLKEDILDPHGLVQILSYGIPLYRTCHIVFYDSLHQIPTKV